MTWIRSEVDLNQLSNVSESLAKIVRGGDVVVLKGDIGAGKTTLVSNVSKHLGVIDSVTSPTFAIVNTYEIPSSKFDLRNLIHVDTYRLENLNEVYDLGLETLFDDKSVTFIEWGERIQEHIGKNYFVVTIDECNPESRDFRFKIEGTLKQVRLSEINYELLRNGWESQE